MNATHSLLCLPTSFPLRSTQPKASVVQSQPVNTEISVAQSRTENKSQQPVKGSKANAKKSPEAIEKSREKRKNAKERRKEKRKRLNEAKLVVQEIQVPSKQPRLVARVDSDGTAVTHGPTTEFVHPLIRSIQEAAAAAPAVSRHSEGSPAFRSISTEQDEASKQNKRNTDSR